MDLQLISEVVPGLSRVAVLSTPNPTAQLGLRETETEVAARSLGVRLQALDVRSPDDLDSAFSAIDILAGVVAGAHTQSD